MKQLEELDAFRLTVEFKLNVYDLVNGSPGASRDLKYKGQMFDAASGAEFNIAEGWARGQTAEMRTFFRYARASLYEARRQVLDGVSRGYFAAPECQKALRLADRSIGAVTNLWKSLEPFTGPNERREDRPPRKRRNPEPRT